MGSLSIGHWLIVLLIVVLVFGTKKLKDAGRDLGGAVRNFKEGMSGPDASQTAVKPEGSPVIEGEAKRDHQPS